MLIYVYFSESNTYISPPLIYDVFDENGVGLVYSKPIKCHPMPDALNPCEDLLGSKQVNISAWLISTLSLVGNTVCFVVITVTYCRNSHTHRFSVDRLLILHLSIADFCMGCYLMLLSSVSTATSSAYYRFYLHWQVLGGCDVAGFLSMLSTHMSMYTLSLISVERWLVAT